MNEEQNNKVKNRLFSFAEKSIYWWTSEDVFVKTILEIIEKNGLDPENFVYSVTEAENKMSLYRRGTGKSGVPFFYAFTFEDIKKFEKDSCSLFEKVKEFNKPVIAMYFTDQVGTIDEKFTLDEIKSLIKKRVIKENPACIYCGKEGAGLKGAYAGSISLVNWCEESFK